MDAVYILINSFAEKKNNNLKTKATTQIQKFK